MAKLIIILALVAGFIMLYRSIFGTSSRLDSSSEAADTVKDPNCGIYIPKKQAIARLIQGREHFFCGKKCADEFSLKKK